MAPQHSLEAAPAGTGSALTNWGGYSSNFGGGFTSSIDIYLNVGGGWNNDTRFAWDTGINNNTGGFLRDFVFNAGFYKAGNSLNHAPQNGFIIDAENNTGRASSFPWDPAYSPYTITSTGWYTFKEAFFKDNGFLGTTMSILNSSGTTLHSWDVDPNHDPIATVGGNNYGWFASNEFLVLGFDNSRLTYATPEPSSLILCGLGALGLFIAARRRRKA